MLREYVCRGATADGDHVAGRHIFDGFLRDGVFEADVHLRLYREQWLAQQRAGGDGTAVHSFQQTLVARSAISRRIVMAETPNSLDNAVIRTAPRVRNLLKIKC